MEGVIFDLIHTLIAVSPDTDAEVLNNQYIKDVLEVLKNENPQLDFDPQQLADQVRENICQDKKNNVIDKTLVQHIIIAQEQIGAFENLLNQILEREDLVDVSKFIIWPQAIETLQQLKQAGYKVACMTNATADTRQRMILKKLGLLDLFDVVVISGAVGLRKPDPKIVEKTMELMDVKKAVVIGDKLTHDGKCANKAGVPFLWMRLKPSGQPGNIKAINNSSISYKSAIISLNQIPKEIELINVKSRFRVGVILPTYEAKRNFGNKRAFISSPDIQYNIIEPEGNLEAQGHFDAIIHRPYPLAAETKLKQEQTVSALQDYTQAHSDVKLIDPISLMQCHLQPQMFFLFGVAAIGQGVDIAGVMLKLPQVLLCDAPPSTPFSELTYPVMLRAIPNQAAETMPHLDSLFVIQNEEGFSNLNPISFNCAQVDDCKTAVFYKCYAIGDQSWSFPKMSIRNLDLGAMETFTRFNTKNFDEEPGLTLPAEFADGTRQLIQSMTQATIFGWELVFKPDEKECYIVNFSYFPDFNEVPTLEEFMQENILFHLNK